MKTTGKIIKMLEVESGKSPKGEWKKQTFVIDTGEEYNNIIAFDVFGAEKVENLTKYNKVGDDVNVQFNISTREHQGKFYTNLQAWRIEKAGEVTNAERQPERELVEDDLPF